MKNFQRIGFFIVILVTALGYTIFPQSKKGHREFLDWFQGKHELKLNDLHVDQNGDVHIFWVIKEHISEAEIFQVYAPSCVSEDKFKIEVNDKIFSSFVIFELEQGDYSNWDMESFLMNPQNFFDYHVKSATVVCTTADSQKINLYSPSVTVIASK